MQITIQATSVLVCAQPVDFRKGIEGLVDIVLSQFNIDPRKSIFIFYNRHRNIEKVYDLEDSQKTCICGTSLHAAGEDCSIQVDHIPETFQVIEHICLKYCCRNCEIIRSAKKPETAISKCLATAGFIAEVITKKYVHHLPLYRQAKMFAELNAEIPDNTLGNWVMRAAESLEPLKEAFKQQIAQTRLLQADETPVQTLKPNKHGYLWAYHGCDSENRFIFFKYASSRGGHVPEAILKNFAGILQTDGYSGYNNLRAKPNIISAGCWDHCRRKFTDVIKVADQTKQGKAAQLLALINQLYDVERAAKTLTPEERQVYRQFHAKPILIDVHTTATAVKPPPKSLLGTAITYLLNQWPYLIAYLDYGTLPISNCWIENQIRPFAVGRKNWLFTRTPDNANKAALLYSLVQSCQMQQISPRKYLEYVLQQAPALRRGEIIPRLLLPQFIDKALLE